jgi:Pro-kumamolisin, activation domain
LDRPDYVKRNTLRVSSRHRHFAALGSLIQDDLEKKEKIMQPFFTFASRALPTQLAAGAAKLRRVWIVILGGLVSPWIAYGGTFAQLATGVSPLVAQSKLISPTDPNQEISIVLVLPLKDANGAAEFAEHVSKPGEEVFGQFITPAEFAARFGADENDYSLVKNWAKDNQLKITDESVSRTTLTVTGKVAQFEALFNVQLNNYRSPNGDEFYSASTAPITPSRIAGQIMAVKPRLVNGYKGGVNDPNIELEAVLDVDMIMAMNPAVNEVLVYEDGKDSFDVALLDALADVASDNAVQTLVSRMARMNARPGQSGWTPKTKYSSNSRLKE